MSDELSNLWRPQDEKGTRLFTIIPNCILREIIGGTHKHLESRVLLFICRMSYGMKSREETGYLSLGDFEAETGIKKTHLSKTIKGLIAKDILLRGKEKAKMYKYAINLYYYDLPMKHYRITNNLDDLRGDEVVFGALSYKFGKRVEGKRAIVVYNSKGYDKQEIGYIKKDINANIKIDNVNKDYLVDSFIKDVRENNDHGTLLKYMQLMYDSKSDPDIILKTYDTECIRKGYVASDIGNKTIEIAAERFSHWLRLSGKC